MPHLPAAERGWPKRQLNQAPDCLLDGVAAVGEVCAVVDGDGRTTCPLTVHELRHARGVELAEAGASDAEIIGAT